MAVTLNYIYFEPQVLHKPTDLWSRIIERKKNVNLVDIGEISPVAPQIGVKLALNTTFWGNKSKFWFIPGGI